MFVVIGAEVTGYEAGCPPDVRRILNPHWADGGAIDSLRFALEHLDAPTRCLVTPVDAAPATRRTLAALSAAGGAAVPVGPDGREGHPVVLGAAEIEQVMNTRPAEGLRTVLASAPRVTVSDPLVSWSSNTPEEFETFRAAFLRHRSLAPDGTTKER